MADDTRNHGYGAQDPYGRTQRAGPGGQAQGDPLAELARLIGQQNESEPPYREQAQRKNVAPVSAYETGRSRDGWSEPTLDPYAQPESHAQYDGYAPRGYSDPLPQQVYADSQRDPRHGDPRYADPTLAPNATPPQAFSDFGHPQSQDQRQDQRYADPRYADPRSGDPRYSDPQPYESAPQGYAANGFAPEPQGYADAQGYAAASYDGQGYAAPQAGYSQDPSDYGNMPSFARSPSLSDPFYDDGSPSKMRTARDDHAPARRRGSIVTVLAVLALAVVGTAAAFGYRAMFGASGTPVPPPVIRADPRPSKMVPVAGDPNAKPIQDRVGGDGERVVSREEAPVDPSRGSNPRVIFPNLADQGLKPAAVAANVGSTGAVPAAGPAEPKKIRTVAIKPDQPGAPARNAQASADPEPVRSQSNAPLALSPAAQQAPAAPRQQAQPPQQLASRGVTSGSASAFPAPIGNGANASVAAGAYAVQVTSQRSESDAQASYKSLQGQFPAVLGSRQPVIKKADLGDKGTYYRAQIPFSSQNEASEFCSSLKAAGGQCVVQKN